MSRLKEIIDKTFLGSLLKQHPKMGIGLSFIIMVYVFIHLFKLEVFPLYTFGMYSKKEAPKTEFHTYSIYQNDEKVVLKSMDYRKYTFLMNTIGQYDGIIENGMVHPESKAIDKFVSRLRLNNSSVESFLTKSHKWNKDNLQRELGDWLASQLNLNINELRIEKELYQWTNDTPQLDRKIVLYEFAE